MTRSLVALDILLAALSSSPLTIAPTGTAPSPSSTTTTASSVAQSPSTPTVTPPGNCFLHLNRDVTLDALECTVWLQGNRNESTQNGFAALVGGASHEILVWDHPLTITTTVNSTNKFPMAFSFADDSWTDTDCIYSSSMISGDSDQTTYVSEHFTCKRNCTSAWH